MQISGDVEFMSGKEEEDYVWEFRVDIAGDAPKYLVFFFACHRACLPWMQLRFRLGGVEVPLALLRQVALLGTVQQKVALRALVFYINMFGDLDLSPERAFTPNNKGRVEPFDVALFVSYLATNCFPADLLTYLHLNSDGDSARADYTIVGVADFLLEHGHVGQAEPAFGKKVTMAAQNFAKMMCTR
eukprot:gb/GEZN01016569.1/.p1 GENE.gb/GEZN01016569.1/~~gb/GEZN01016569.1/.p1  ORF type:complete len:187 (+),score=21.85 gb/GEZN01016569.1/:202-762(+)